LLATGRATLTHQIKVGKCVLVIAVLLATGCHQVGDRGCDRFAEMETLCEVDTEGTARVKQLAMMVCSEARTTEDDWLSQLQARQVQCAQESPSCEMYQDCKIQIVLP